MLLRNGEPRAAAMALLVAGLCCLVTGASGFIGRHLCRRLAAAGADVYAVSRASRQGAGVRWWTADLTDADATRALLASIRPTVIFHLASEVTGARGLDAVHPTLRANLIAAVNVLVAGTEVGVERVVLAGSIEEPGAGGPDHLPGSPYAAAKGAAAAYAQMFHTLYGTPTVLARLSMVYGPDQPDREKLVPYVTEAFLRGRAPQLSSGTRPVDWVFVEDVVEGLVEVARAPGLTGQTVDLGSGSLVTVREVVGLIRRLTGAEVEPRFGALPDRALEVVRAADLARTRALVGWSPRTSLEDGLARTVAWHRERLDREARAAS